jgi:peptide/nickel transport system permease protein
VVSFIIRRLIQTAIVVFLVSLLAFLILKLIPGDPVAAMLGGEATQEKIVELQKQLWLDRPVVVQYLHWLGNAVHGDFGRSIAMNQKVTELIAERLPVTLYLSLISFILSPLLGISLGVWGAIKRGRFIDPFISLFANIGVAVPIFWLAILGIYFLGFKAHLLAIQGFTWPTVDFVKSIQQTVMPVVCLSVPALALLARQTRSSVLEVVRQDYVRTAMAKGLKQHVVVLRHVLKNALIPVITLLGLQVRVLFGGAILVEQVFNISGMGRLVVGAALNKDFLVLQGGVLVIALAVCLANLLVDISYSWLDPRIKYV